MVTQVSSLLPPRFLPSIFIAHRVQQSHCSSSFHRVLLTHAPALSASQFVPKKKSQRIHTSMHSAGLELTKPTYTRLEDNLIRHRGDRLYIAHGEHLLSQEVEVSHTSTTLETYLFLGRAKTCHDNRILVSCSLLILSRPSACGRYCCPFPLYLFRHRE